MSPQVQVYIIRSVPGSPFGFRVVDASKLTASGDGLRLAPCNKLSSFRILAEGARKDDLDIKINSTYTTAFVPLTPNSNLNKLSESGWGISV